MLLRITVDALCADIDGVTIRTMVPEGSLAKVGIPTVGSEYYVTVVVVVDGCICHAVLVPDVGTAAEPSTDTVGAGKRIMFPDGNINALGILTEEILQGTAAYDEGC